MISIEKWKILTPLKNLPRNEVDLGQLVVAKGSKKLPKVQKKLPNLVTLVLFLNLASVWMDCLDHPFFAQCPKFAKGDNARRINVDK